MDETKEAITKHQVNAGRVGGRSRSPAKRAAVRANLAKARAKRWPGREAGPQGNTLGSGYVAENGGDDGEQVRPQMVLEAAPSDGSRSSGDSNSPDNPER